MECIIDSATYFDGDEELFSFVIQELDSMAHQINDFSYRWTVYMLKHLLVGISILDLREDQMSLTCNSTMMEDDKLINVYVIINGTVKHLIPRLRGGARIKNTTYVDLIPFLINDSSSDSSESSDEDSDEKSLISDWSFF